ncbi:hypothetical protein ABIF65_010871 [Bradyrhizobium japonicum]|jgi:hypothetical protein|uniref:hypothetical protein n=1 Tax=Bradyrhizobium TaxID=374 RepID=UPI0004291FF4|nr:MULTISPECIES: hypothetical protein [Bradyrhizobium]MBR0884520.1 hypothetical protein [Bradyrhizobium liaoningense]MBR0948216.1 hypothetical protein [Bradyrhizobium liaoningense]MBR1004385.1 hypothetical protein [Bradyrhizobium liaoningense]MBR1033457.1 hypothetical protein [Bradyrhizobium liaoningense]MBR1070530.1 hypothetical protein [Bradyrhizobium liaoningense]
MKPILYQHELAEELEKRPGVAGLKLIRVKGYIPSWELGGIRQKPLDESAEAAFGDEVHKLQDEYDMA